MLDVLAWAAHLPEVTFPDRAEILVDGRRHQDLLILVQGAVRISKAGAQISVIDQPGAIFGEMALLLGTPATATVTALGECRFLHAAEPGGAAAGPPRTRHGHRDHAGPTAVRDHRIPRDLRNQYADSADHLAVVDVVLESLLQHQGREMEPGSDREPESPH